MKQHRVYNQVSLRDILCHNHRPGGGRWHTSFTACRAASESVRIPSWQDDTTRRPRGSTLLGILRCVHVLCMPESGDREGNKQEDCINLWSAGEGEGTRGARLVEGTPHNQAPVSAVSRRLIQLVSIPASAPQASTKGAHIVLFKTHARGTDSI